MTKPQLGVKRDCPNCGARFYDLSKSPAHCPKCQHDFVPEVLLKPRKPRREDEPVEEAPAPVAAVEAPLAELDKENKAAKSKKKPALDQETPADPDAIEDIEDLDVDIEDDDTLLEEDAEDDDDLSDVVSGGEGDEEV